MEVELHSLETKWSPGMFRILDYKPDDVKPSYQRFLERVHPEDWETVKRDIEFALNSLHSAVLDFRVLSKKGEEKYIHAKVLIHTNRKGQATFLKGFAQDVTDVALSEKSLLNARLEKQNAENLARAKHMFLANMSHEIRTPMNAILGMSHQLGKTTLDERQQFYLETIHSAAGNLLAIINDILDLSKIEAGKIQLEHISFDLKKLIHQTIQVQLLSAEQKGLGLAATNLDENMWPVFKGDPHRINQVLTNLVSNAIKFTEKGRVELSLEVLEDSEKSQTLQVQLKDTGVGMDESFLKHLFDKFSQENESTTRTHGGTGLGMSICKELIELMGGKIYAKSKKGAGTTISFILQLFKGDEAELLPKEQPKFVDAFLKGKKIMVADDNEMNRLLAEVILQNHGAKTIEAENGEEVISLINQKPDLILMDIQMPHLNGFDAAKKLREMKVNVPIIALTANVIKGERERSVGSGMNDYIAKPFAEEELLTLIDKWLKAGETPEQKPTLPAEGVRLFDLTKLRVLSRGNEVFVQKMIKIFCEQAPQMVKEMQEAYQRNDFDRIAAIAHKMKPSIENLGINEVGQRIKWIEKNARDKSEIPIFSKTLSEIEEFVLKVITAMGQASL